MGLVMDKEFIKRFKSLIWGFLIAVLLVNGQIVHAQTNSTYQQPRFIRFVSQNDLYQKFIQSDRHFSNGSSIELAHPLLGNKFSTNVLLGFKSSTPTYQDYSISINQDLFTSTRTQLIQIDSGDRPYAALLYADYSRITNDFARGRKLKTSLKFGVQGPAAYGEQSQNGAHGILGNDIVRGWPNQISNGLILDYSVQFDQLLPLNTPVSEVVWISQGQVGTIFNYVTTGFKFKFGYFRDSFLGFSGLFNRRYKHQVTGEEEKVLAKTRYGTNPKRIREDCSHCMNKKLDRKLDIHFSIALQARYTLYNGTMEGSLVQFEKNRYLLKWDEYDHFQFFGVYEVNFNYRNFQITYRQVAEDDNIDHRKAFGWGIIEIMVLF
jgi:lipid A 3-O-deacylase